MHARGHITGFWKFHIKKGPLTLHDLPVDTQSLEVMDTVYTLSRKTGMGATGAKSSTLHLRVELESFITFS